MHLHYVDLARKPMDVLDMTSLTEDANLGKLRFKAEDEQVLWSECSRFITNCIIYYNATILSRLLQQHQAAGDVAASAELTQVSPVAWQHINLYGRYEFTRTPAPIDIDTMAATLTQRAR